MGLLDHLFNSEESIAKELKLDDDSIIKSWNDYLGTISKKKPIIERLKADSSLKASLLALKKLLEIGLADIHGEEKEEEELISDLEALEHSQKIKRVQRLQQCLGYAETKYEYVHGLLHQMHSILKTQMHIAEKLLAGSKDPEKLISHLKSQFELEWTVMKKIIDMKTFHNLFSALVKGEHIVKTMDSSEKRLLSMMQKIMYDSPNEKMTASIIYDWSTAVFDAIEDRVHEAVADGVLDHHPDVDFEFVNRPEFVDLAKEKIKELRGKDTLEPIINAFVHMFREWFNHERD